MSHWGRVRHICVTKITIIGSDNGLAPIRRQAIIWTNAGIMLFWTLRNKLQWNFNQNPYIFNQENAFENAVWKMEAICLGLNVLFRQTKKTNQCRWSHNLRRWQRYDVSQINNIRNSFTTNCFASDLVCVKTITYFVWSQFQSHIDIFAG